MQAKGHIHVEHVGKLREHTVDGVDFMFLPPLTALQRQRVHRGFLLTRERAIPQMQHLFEGVHEKKIRQTRSRDAFGALREPFW